MISPKEAAKRNDALYADQLAAAEKKIDAELARSYGTGRSVSIDTDSIGLKDHHLREKLMARYRSNGWEIKHHSDQREQSSYYTFTARKHESTDYFNR